MSQARALIFHGIGTPGRELEPGEQPYWISLGLFEAVLDLIRTRPDKDRIRLTFDDGNASDAELALPRLQQRGLGATFFALTGRIGKYGSLDAGAIRTIVNAGMQVGSHGVDHRDWARLDRAALDREVHESRSRLSAICGAPIAAAAIPFGSYNRSVLAALKNAGYRSAYSSDGGAMSERHFLRPRTSVKADTTLEQVDAFLSGREPLTQRLRQGVGQALRRMR